LNFCGFFSDFSNGIDVFFFQKKKRKEEKTFMKKKSGAMSFLTLGFAVSCKKSFKVSHNKESLTFIMARTVGNISPN